VLSECEDVYVGGYVANHKGGFSGGLGAFEVAERPSNIEGNSTEY
jgi:hypothetical protein